VTFITDDKNYVDSDNDDDESFTSAVEFLEDFENEFNELGLYLCATRSLLSPEDSISSWCNV